MTEMQPDCGASPARDRDSLSNLSGTFNFTSGSHAVSVSVIIGAPGDNEGQAVTAPHDPPRGNTLNEEMDVTLT